MRKLLPLILFALLTPFAALAEIDLQLNTSVLPVGDILDFTVSPADAAEYRFVCLKGNQTLWESAACAEAFGSFRPREAGEYTLRVTAVSKGGQSDTAARAFTVSGMPSCTIAAGQAQLRAGEAIACTVQAANAAGECSYTYAVWRGNEKIAQETTARSAWEYTPATAGDYRVEVALRDALGHEATARCDVTVLPGDGLSVSGDKGAFFAAGGARKWIVHAPGVWRAEAEGGFISLSADCGADGDALIITLPPTKQTRSGGVTISCGQLRTRINVSQSADSGEEEEISFGEARQTLLIDGEAQAAWLCEDASRAFAITAPGAWTAQCDADFVSLRQEERRLTVSLSPNDTQDVRQTAVRVSSGAQEATLFLFQPPENNGADIEAVTLSATGGMAYRDDVRAVVQASADAERVRVSCAAWQEDIVVQTKTDGMWAFSLPLRGAGEQTLLFSAENTRGSRKKQAVTIQVTGEAAAFAGEATAAAEETRVLLRVRTTAAAERIEVIDETGAATAFTAKNAKIDRCVSADGRYAQWELSLPADARVSAVRLGGETAAVRPVDAAEKPFTIYSQCDGWWADKQYRHSNLQQSGCAVFALAHALQTLNFTGEEILPENLAVKYAFCLSKDGGTINSTLVGHAGDDLGFKTRYALYESLPEIYKKLSQGAVFSFSIVSGHIAMVAEGTPDQTKFRIIDSAPSATWERIKGARLYIAEGDGFRAINALSEIPGIRFYPETGQYGGAAFYLDAAYVAGRGVRLIQPK